MMRRFCLLLDWKHNLEPLLGYLVHIVCQNFSRDPTLVQHRFVNLVHVYSVSGIQQFRLTCWRPPHIGLTWDCQQQHIVSSKFWIRNTTLTQWWVTISVLRFLIHVVCQTFNLLPTLAQKGLTDKTKFRPTKSRVNIVQYNFANVKATSGQLWHFTLRRQW